MPTPVERAEQLFLAALDLSESERNGFLEAECAGDEPLRRQVENLLRLDGATDNLSRLDAVLEPGERIGPYELREPIGEGGMGIVYRAEQREPVRRMVAIKLLKPGLDSREIVARFEAERQALVLMDHPNIAKVFDAGETERGYPYFAMELIEGVPITNYCDVAQLTIEDRIRLLLPVCRAVQHAHQKGVIHRDIKPNNVLVAMRDGQPVPIVIDFGIAKAIASPLTEKTLYTSHHQVLGTLEYMSPEQAEMSPITVDTRSDVYSLGVLLYELMAGVTPIEAATLRRAGLLEAQRLIREADPLRPSTRVSSLGEVAADIAKRRRVDPGSLRRHMRGDLDWITMRCLEKDPQRRYQSANDFAVDLERHLRHAPVDAGPPGVLYRTAKFARRHRVATTAVAGILLSLLLGAVFVLIERSQNQRLLTELGGVDRAARLRDVQDSIDGDGSPRRRLEVLEDEETFPREHRGFVWEWLHARSTLPEPILIDFEGSHARSVEFHPDGDQVLIVRAPPDRQVLEIPGKVEFWSIRERSRHRALPGRALAAHFLDGGRRVVSADVGSGKLLIWEPDADPNRPIAASTAGPSPFTLAVARDGTIAAAVKLDTGSYGLRVYSWDGTRLTERTTFSFPVQQPRIRAVALDSSGEHLAVGDATGLVRVLDPETGREISRARYGRMAEDPAREHDGKARIYRSIRDVALSPDGRRLAVVGDADGYSGLFSTADGGLVHVVEPFRPGGEPRSSRCAAFDPDGRWLFTSGSGPQNNRVHSVRTGEVLATLPARAARSGGNRYVSAIAVGPDARRIALSTVSWGGGGGGGALTIWDLAELPMPIELIGHVDDVEGITVCDDHRHVFTFDSSSVRKWDLETGRQVFAYRDLWLGPRRLAVRPEKDGRAPRQVAVGGESGRGVILDANHGTVIREFTLPDHVRSKKPGFARYGITALTYTPDGETLVVGPGTFFNNHDPEARAPVLLYDADEMSIRRELPGHSMTLGAVHVTSDGSRLIAEQGGRGHAAIWDLNARSDQPLFEVPLYGGSRTALDPQGRLLFAQTSPHMITIYDPQTGDPVDQWPCSEGRVNGFDFHPSAGVLLTTKVRTTIWDDPPRNRLAVPLPGRLLTFRSRSVFVGDRGILASDRHGGLTYYPKQAEPDEFAVRRTAWRAARVIRDRLDVDPLQDLIGTSQRLDIPAGSDEELLALVSEVEAAVRSDTTLPDEVRSAALQLLRTTNDDAEALSSAGAKLFLRNRVLRDRNRAALHRARRYGEEARRRARPGTYQEAVYDFLLGMICYRLEDDEAVLVHMQKAKARTKLWRTARTSRPDVASANTTPFAVRALVLRKRGEIESAHRELEAAYEAGIGGNFGENWIKQAQKALRVHVPEVDQAPAGSAMKAAGPPDAGWVNRSRNAWFPTSGETLTLEYEKAIPLMTLRVFAVGSLHALEGIDALDPGGKWQPIWPGRTSREDATFRYDGAPLRTSSIRLVFSERAKGDTGIDTVRLIGGDERQWPMRARAGR